MFKILIFDANSSIEWIITPSIFEGGGKIFLCSIFCSLLVITVQFVYLSCLLLRAIISLGKFFRSKDFFKNCGPYCIRRPNYT